MFYETIEQAIATNEQLEAENARLKRQLDIVLTAIGYATSEVPCPGSAGLKHTCQPNCETCWRKALEEVETDDQTNP
ncbi:MAG: hypothetical protein AB7E31_04405 [Desulfitobacterium sp.]